MTPKTVWICGVCGRIVENVLTGPHTGELVHTFGDQKTADHPVIPVEVSPDKANLRCDVCHDDTSVFDAWTLTTAAIPWIGGILSPHWLLCPPCAALVQADDWNALAQRGIDGWVSRHGPMGKPEENFLRWMYSKVRTGFTGITPPITAEELSP